MRSPYPLWEPAERPGLVLDEGHQMPATTVRDADLDEVLELPSESAWPLLVALPVTLAFVLLLGSHYVAAGVLLAVAGLAVAGWHAGEPQAA